MPAIVGVGDVAGERRLARSPFADRQRVGLGRRCRRRRSGTALPGPPSPVRKFGTVNVPVIWRATPIGSCRRGRSARRSPRDGERRRSVAERPPASSSRMCSIRSVMLPRAGDRERPTPAPGRRGRRRRSSSAANIVLHLPGGAPRCRRARWSARRGRRGTPATARSASPPAPTRPRRRDDVACGPRSALTAGWIDEQRGRRRRRPWRRARPTAARARRCRRRRARPCASSSSDASRSVHGGSRLTPRRRGRRRT